MSKREERGNWEKEREGKLRNRAKRNRDILFEKKKLFLTKKKIVSELAEMTGRLTGSVCLYKYII